jgi:two-component system, sporulation sensor kinase E
MQQHRNIEQKLEWYKSFFDNAGDAVLIVQPETWLILDANTQASALLGIRHDELITSALPQFRRVFKLLVRSESDRVLSELSIETFDGRTVNTEIHASFIDYEGEQLIQAIARDVTDQRALTEKMVQADKMVLLGQLSASLAHEIRNPLAAVKINLQYLARTTPEASDQYSFLHSALQGVDRIQNIVDSTLNFSRVTPPVFKKTSINDVTLQALNLSSPALRRKNIRVVQDLNDNLPLVSLDTKQIQQVFVNLITNAADAMQDNGTLTLSSTIEKVHDKDSAHLNNTSLHDGDHIVVSVRDTGTGIPTTDLSKIFDPFFTRKADGTGLGLPISLRIIQHHNGSIDVQSTVGQGTTFYVKLPVAD